MRFPAPMLIPLSASDAARAITVPATGRMLRGLGARLATSIRRGEGPAAAG